MKNIKFKCWSENLGMSEPVDIKNTINSDIDKYDTYLLYTGLKDKNDKEIYEGDIVEIKYKRYEFDGSTLEDFEFMGYLVYHELTFDICVSKDGSTFSPFVQEKMLIGDSIDEEWEVLGNIYESPELLEDK